MKTLMRLKKGVYYKEFILKNVLVEALNLNYLNQQEKAIALLQPVISKKHKDIESLLDIHLSLLMFYFQKGDLSNAKSILAKFYHTDQYYTEKAGIDWVIKKNLAEILLYIEHKDEDVLQSRLKSFRRSYSKYLKGINQERILTFLYFSEQLHNHPNIISDHNFTEQVAFTFEKTSTTSEDIFVISFYAWLKSKVTKQNLLQTTLKLAKPNVT